MPLFPARIRKRLRYCTSASLASTSGLLSTYQFRANDLFDPDYTSTGHQPMGFDQMMVFYNHFAVDRAMIKVQFTNLASGPMRVGIRLDAGNVPLTNYTQMLEFGGLTDDVLESKSVYGSSKTLQASVDIAKIQGIPRKNITTDPSLRGDAVTSPTEITYFHVVIWDPLGNGGTVNFDVFLEQSAWFFEPRDISQSLNKRVEALQIVQVAPSDSKEAVAPVSSGGGWFTSRG